MQQRRTKLAAQGLADAHRLEVEAVDEAGAVEAHEHVHGADQGDEVDQVAAQELFLDDFHLPPAVTVLEDRWIVDNIARLSGRLYAWGEALRSNKSAVLGGTEVSQRGMRRWCRTCRS